MFHNNINQTKVREIVKDFLAQAHSVHKVEEPILEDDAWRVDADVTTFGVTQIKKVKVDPETGRIISSESFPNPRTRTLQYPN